MQQHPVPQNISGFEFKLVGFLTLKQFGYLAVAGVFSFIFFISPAPGLVKFILIAPMGIFAALLAFVPINGIPFDKWLVIFIKAIYAPSRRVWRKEPKEISFLSPYFSAYLKRPQPAHQPITRDKSRLDSYISKLRADKKTSAVDQYEERRLSSLDFSATVPHFKTDKSEHGVESHNRVEAS